MGGMRVARRTVGTCTALWVGVALALVAAPAGAQDPDPYGGTTTTAGGTTAEASCSLSVTVGEAGDPVTATVINVEVGGTVRILFGGVEVGRATAPAQGGEAQTTTSVSITFEVPDVEPGRYLVTAVGADFTATCSASVGGQFEVRETEVLAGGVTRDGGGEGGSSLPRTGLYLALLVTIAIGLLLLGRTLLERSRRRRRRAHRAAWQAGNHLLPSRQRTTK